MPAGSAATRKTIPPTLRWAVFARDGFACRYCGARAGQPGVELHADHLRSVADGGRNTITNLVTACGTCNGGKGAQSLAEAPAAAGVADRMRDRAASIRAQADQLEDAVEEERRLTRKAIRLKEVAYECEGATLRGGEARNIISLCRKYGAENVLAWYRTAHQNHVPAHNAVKYVYGIVRRLHDSDGGVRA